MKISSLRVKFFIFVSVSIAVISIPLVYIDYYQRDKMLTEHFSQNRKAMIEYLSYDARESLETGLYGIFKEKAKNLSKRFYINSVELRDSTNRSIIVLPDNPKYTGIVETLDIFASSESSLLDIEINSRTSSDPRKVGTLVVFYDQSIYDRQAHELLMNTFLLVVFIIIIGFACVYVSEKFISFPIYAISKAIREIQSGNYKYRIGLSRNDELGGLIELVNHTGSVLEKYDDDREKVYELKHNILQIAAHELRSPLGSLKTCLDIAIHHNSEGRHKNTLSILKRCFSDIEALDRHITSILCLSALESNSLTRNDDWVAVGSIFSELEKQFIVKCNSKPGVTWSCNSIGSVDGMAFLDLDLVSIIVSNAIDNAVKYTKIGFVQVSYGVNDGELFISVHDSGEGISEEELNELTDRPDQLQNTIRRKRDGWGIGLATMYRFANFLGGQIDIESKKEFGTKVKIRIPIEYRKYEVPVDSFVSCSEPEEHPKPKSVYSGHSTTIGADGVRVLVVDNDPQHLLQMQELLSPEFLRRDDVEVTCCSVSSDAIGYVEECNFDLLFIDYHMPDIDGLQFLRFINTYDNQCKHSYKIILTADANIPDTIKSEIMTLGDRIISKGITRIEVREIIRSITLKSVG